jgi:hypothetical protein
MLDVLCHIQIAVVGFESAIALINSDS